MKVISKIINQIVLHKVKLNRGGKNCLVFSKLPHETLTGELNRVCKQISESI